jgi:hypothetical protein
MGMYGNNILDYKVSLITEAYIGKTETLREIEEQVGIVRRSVKRYTDIDKSKEVQKLNRLVEKQFGMDVFALHIDQSKMMDAYSVPIASRFDISFSRNLSKMVVGDTTNGFRFKKNNNFCIMVCLSYGLLTYDKFTDAEIVAIMLHEIGHNFADCLDNRILTWNQTWCKDVTDMLVLKSILTCGLYIPFAAVKYYNNTNSKARMKGKSKIYNPLRGLLNGVKSVKDDFRSITREIFYRLGGGVDINVTINGKDADKIKMAYKQSPSRSSEVIADKFAGIYGYGPEIASALYKLEENVGTAERITMKINNERNKQFNDAWLKVSDFDEHPQLIQRINENIKLLENELDSSHLDPKLEGVIRSQLKEMKDQVKDLTTVVNKSRSSENARKTFNAYINKTAPDAVTEEIEDTIEDELNKILYKK